MGHATVRNQRTIDLTTAIVHDHLRVYYGSTVIGTMTDEFCRNTKVPGTVRLYVAYLPDGTAVSGTWGENGTPFVDDPTNARIYADMPTPADRAPPNDFAFTIAEGLESDDPHLVLKTNVDC